MQGQGAYFVQVGAFKSQDTAKRSRRDCAS
jgi:cell division protein FtsN